MGQFDERDCPAIIEGINTQRACLTDKPSMFSLITLLLSGFSLSNMTQGACLSIVMRLIQNGVADTLLRRINPDQLNNAI